MTNEGSEEKQEEVTDSGSATVASATDFKFIYFYYIKKKEEHSEIDEQRRHPGWELQVFLEKRNGTEEPDEAEIRQLISAADGKQIHPRAFKIDGLPLRHKSYMLFVWKEAKRKLKKADFIFEGPPKKTDHSFRWFKEKQLSPELSAVYCVNERLNKDGRPLGSQKPETERFKVDFRTTPKLPLAPKPIHDEAATNIGP